MEVTSQQKVCWVQGNINEDLRRKIEELLNNNHYAKYFTWQFSHLKHPAELSLLAKAATKKGHLLILLWRNKILLKIHAGVYNKLNCQAAFKYWTESASLSVKRGEASGSCSYMPGSNSLPETEQWLANIAGETPNPSFWITRASTASHVAHLPALTHSSSAHGSWFPASFQGRQERHYSSITIFPLGRDFCHQELLSAFSTNLL